MIPALSFVPRASVRAALLLAPALGFWLGAPASVRAVALPATALAQSTQTPSELLDDPANLFLFPQVSPAEGPELWTFGGYEDVTRGVVAHLSLGRHRFHYLVNRGVSSGVREGLGFPVFRAGWATCWRGVRLGASYAWAAEASKRTRDRRQHWDRGVELATESWFEYVDYQLGSLGLGFERGRMAVELVWNLGGETLRHESRDYEVVQGMATYSARELKWEYTADGALRNGFALRVETAVSPRLRVRAFGAFQDGSRRVLRSHQFDQWEDDVHLARETGAEGATERGQEWSCGLRLAASSSPDREWAIHLHYENRRPAPAHDVDLRYSRVTSICERDDRAEVGTSLRLPLRWDLELRAGLVVRSLIMEERTEEVRGTDLLHAWERGERSEAVVTDFGWGLRRSFGGVEVTAALSGNLMPTRLFALLDARIAL